MNSSNGNFLDENGNPVNIVQLLKTGKAVPVENPGPGLHMAAHSGWFTDENGKPVNIVALIDAAIDEDGGDEPAIGGISINGGNVVTPDANGIINLTISGDGSTVIDSELSKSSTNPVQNKVVTGEINSLNESVNSLNGSLGNEEWKPYKKAKAAVSSKDNTTLSYDESTDTLSVTATSATYNGFYVTIGAVPVGAKCHVSFDYSVISGTPEFLVSTKQAISGSTVTRLADPVDGHCDNTWIKQPNDLYFFVYISGSTKKAVSISVTNFIMEVSSGGAKDVVTRDTFNMLDGTTPIDVTWTPGWIDLSGDTTDFTVTVGVSLSYAIVPCKNIDSFTLTLANGGDTTALIWAFVDDDGNILAKSLDTKAEYEIVNVPSQATKIVLHTNKPWISDAVRTQPSLIKNAITKIGYEKDLTHTFTLVEGRGVYYNLNGQGSNSANASCTPFIEVAEFDAIRFIRRRVTASSPYGCSFYKEAINNKDGNFIKGYRDPHGYSKMGYEEIEVPVPEEAVYFRSTWYANSLSYRDDFPFYVIGIKYGEFGQHIEDIESSTKSISDVVFSNPDDMYAEEMADTISKAENSLIEPALVFMWSTDCHRYSSNADGVQNFADMVKNMRYFNKKVPCDFMLNTGDMTDGNTDKSTTLTRAHTCLSELRTIGIPYVWAQGNHDTNGYNDVFTMDECHKAYFTATSKEAILNKSEYGTDYYIDYIGLGVRFIVLNANNVDNAHDKLYYVYGRTVATWLTSALDTDMDVIIALHQTPVSSQTYNNQGTTGSAGVISAINNFVSNGGQLVMISGHTHADMAFISPWMSIMQDCQRYCSVTEDSINGRSDITTGFIDVIRKNARSKEDARKDLWSVGIYKPISKDFDFIRFGAGKDRYFHTTPIAPQTLVSRFDSPTWATSDENIATVVDGVVTGVATGKCTIVARDAEENYECWIVNVE